MAFACTLPAIPTARLDDETIGSMHWDVEPGSLATRPVATCPAMTRVLT
jgi:hypothetical protein